MQNVEIGVFWEVRGHPRPPSLSPFNRAHMTSNLTNRNCPFVLYRFYAGQHICYSAYMPWQFRLSVRPSVCPSHGWISQKRLKLWSRNFHHTVAHPSSFSGVSFIPKF